MQLITIISSNTARVIQINGSILAVDEDICSDIYPKQSAPAIRMDKGQTMMVCHPAALKRVLNTLQEGENRIQYVPVPPGIKGTECLQIKLQEFYNYIK